MEAISNSAAVRHPEARQALDEIGASCWRAAAVAHATAQAITTAFANGAKGLGGADDASEAVGLSGAVESLLAGLPEAARRIDSAPLVESLELCELLADVVASRVLEGDADEQRTAAPLARLLARQLREAATMAAKAARPAALAA
jgi:hypothetical protein